MRKSNELEKIWVSKEFKNILKSEAALSGKSLLEFTREEARRYKLLSEEKRNAKRFL